MVPTYAIESVRISSSKRLLCLNNSSSILDINLTAYIFNLDLLIKSGFEKF